MVFSSPNRSLGDLGRFEGVATGKDFNSSRVHFEVVGIALRVPRGSFLYFAKAIGHYENCFC